MENLKLGGENRLVAVVAETSSVKNPFTASGPTAHFQYKPDSANTFFVWLYVWPDGKDIPCNPKKIGGVLLTSESIPASSVDISNAIEAPNDLVMMWDSAEKLKEKAVENEELQAEQDENAKQLSEYGKKKVTPPKREKKPQKAAASVEKKPKAEKRPREDNFIPWPKAAHKDPVIKALSGDERWTFMGLWSLAWAVKSPNNEMYYGRIRKTRSGPTPRKEIAEELEIPYATLRKHIVKLKKVNLIDTEDGYIRIVDFEAWQGGWRYAENAKDGCSVGNTDVL